MAEGGIQEFWYGSAERWSANLFPRVMVSYNAIRRLRKPWPMERPMMEDSGAFQVILLHGKYPWSPEEYAESLGIWKPEVAWTMDYPCEPSLRKLGRYTSRQAQTKTNANTRRLNELGANVQSVVQGWTVRDYLENIDRLKQDGLLTPRLGIGSVCRRNATPEIVRVVRAIRANVPGWVKLHGFGVKATALRSEARFLLHSADSASWRIRAFRNRDGVRGKPIGEKERILRPYIDRMEGLLGPRDPMREIAGSDIYG